MRGSIVMLAASGAAMSAVLSTAVPAHADSPVVTIGQLEAEGFHVNVDRIGNAPLDQCTVTSVRNPQRVGQLLPYVGPGLGGDRILVPAVTSQTVSVSLNCQR
ncbi:hypothetical protein A5699_07280 [Mycobacterium sp. E802]|uniref:hypothetical protein n=1 Tax=Mycobacterium sp. E802 TaxID=1834152 RepID=UPI0007FF8923|nr:hypothetical protein [Mycobacterium sp. E802]OBG82086.1 hypothetical protein A5699_07280 [Mycobacterium sp. E802]